MRTSGLLAGAVLVLQMSVHAQESELEALLVKAGQYLAAYGEAMSGAFLEEKIVVSELNAGRVSSMRNYTSHVEFRSADEALTTMRSIQSAHFFPPHFGAQTFDPFLGLRFLDERHQARISYKISGRKRMNNVQVVGVTFDEGKPVLGVAPLAGPAKPETSGRIWIDPETGAVHSTEVWVRSEKQTVTSRVEFAPSQTLGVTVPKSASHSLVYLQTETQVVPSKGPIPGARQTYEVTVTYSNK